MFALITLPLLKAQLKKMKWNESGFRPALCTYRLNWARRTSWGWCDDWDDTVLLTQDSKFEPWRSEAEHATYRSRRQAQLNKQNYSYAAACIASAGAYIAKDWNIIGYGLHFLLRQDKTDKTRQFLSIAICLVVQSSIRKDRWWHILGRVSFQPTFCKKSGAMLILGGVISPCLPLLHSHSSRLNWKKWNEMNRALGQLCAHIG